MFKIVLLAYTVLVGKPIGAPQAFDSEHTFASIEACEVYLHTANFEQRRGEVASTVANAITTADKEDGVPGVAVTASCEDDDRL